MKVLITGFNQFGQLPYNPTQFLVEELENRKNLYQNFTLYTAILPTEFQQSKKEIEYLLSTYTPDIVILTGVSISTNIPLLERVALNIDDSIENDNLGIRYKGTPIYPDGKEAYISDIPLEDVVENFRRIGINIGVSNHAGTFVCNHVYYIAKHFIEKNNLSALCVFMHIPFLSIESASLSKKREINIIYMLDVIQKLIHVFITLKSSKPL